jgi:hypothetical protein
LKLADELRLDSTLPILLSVLFSAISAKAFWLSYAMKLSMSFLEGKKHQTPEMNSRNASVISGNHQ